MNYEEEHEEPKGNVRFDAIPREVAEALANIINGWTPYDVNLELHGGGICSVEVFEVDNYDEFEKCVNAILSNVEE